MPLIDYTPPPTCSRFMQDTTFARLIAGPVGSGKSTACMFELLRRACSQAPAPDGFRYTRFAIVRQTLKQIKDTVLKDILAWFKGIAEWKVSDSTVYINIGDVRSEWLLIPLDEPESQRRLLSMQLTGAWVNECIEIDYDLMSSLIGRCGRYPSAALGGCSWMGVICDTNMPSEGSDWHRLMTAPPVDWQIFTQPSGMSDQAENLEWLLQTTDTLQLPPDDPARQAQGRQYYERFVRSNSPAWCKRYVYAEFGDDPSGTAVFKDTFKRAVHVVDALEPVPGTTLLVGQDFGRNPCSLITQIDGNGRLLILEEILAEDTGLQLHVNQNVRPRLMQSRYLGKPLAFIGDPSGIAKDSLYEETSFDLLKRLGFACFPAPTNDIDSRIRAVEAFLLLQVRGGPGFLVDGTRCPELVRALSGGYRYSFTKDLKITKPTPDKGKYSHIADALQYACLGSHGGMVSGYINRQLMRPKGAGERMPASAWT